MSKTIEEIKDEYAINLAGYNTWDELINDEPSYRVEIHTDQVAERYAKSKTQELIEQNRELVSVMEEVQIELLNLENPAIPDTQLCIKITELLTKYQKP